MSTKTRHTQTKLFKKTSNFVVAGLFLCFFALLYSTPTHAHFVSLSTSGDIVLNLAPNPSSDTTGVGKDTLTISTTCTAGYNLGISSSSSSASLYLNGDTNNTSSSNNVVINPVSGTDTLSTNEWGYSTASNSISGSFTGLSPTISVLSSSSTSATNQNLDVYYGVKLSNIAKPGSYTMPVESSVPGAIVYYLTMDPTCTMVDITYDGNNADEGTMAAVHSGVREGDTVNLIASNFSRNGYGFAGWSTDPDAGTKLIDNDTTNNPIVYGPQESVTIPEGFLDNDTDNDGIVELYAVWIPSQGDLQGWTGCNDLDTATYDATTGALDLTKRSITALTDQRDNDVYAIARLADGKCWMIENLRLDAEATRGNNQNDPSLTNEFLAQGYGKSSTYGNFIGLADSESGSFFNTTPNSIYYSGTQSGTAIINIGTSYSSNRMPRYNNTNTTNRAINPTTNGSAMYSYGNYYTWHAAIANLATNSTNNNSTTGTSLCPVGWHLPTGGMAYASGNTSGVNVTGDMSTFREFYNLGYKIMNEIMTAYEDWPNAGQSYYTPYTTNIAGKIASAAFRDFPNNFLYSGYYDYSLSSNAGSGNYWSSTASNVNNSYELTLDNYTVKPGTNTTVKNYGYSIRCISSDPETHTLTYNANGGSNAPSSPEPISANGLVTFTISNTTPTRSGYTFAGWTDEKGNEVQPGGTFRTKDQNAVLYAIWTNNSCNPTATTIGTGNTTTDAVCLQDVKPSMKASLPIADATIGTYNLIDARDGQSYTVAKLADGNLWLTKNLNYGGTNDALLTSYDTDLPSGTTFKAPASTTAFETTNNNDTYISPKILTDNTYGGYYSYAAAIASTDAYSSSNQNITTSICPKGWDLPTSAIYNNLRTASGNTTFAKMNAAPYSFIYAGYRNGTSFNSQTNILRLWTSTNFNSPYAYYSTAYGIADYFGNYKRYGESVRCVASNGTATIHYDANGGSGTMPVQIGDINSISIDSNAFTAPAGSQFREWNTRADGSGMTVTPNTLLSSIVSNGDIVTLYAQWDEIYYIAFNANGGTGTMTNQTVVRDVATTIKTNTFTLAGHIFIGWNTSADGTGTFYSDSQQVTNLTTTGDTITLYAVWAEGAYLSAGSTVNQKLKRLAGNNSASYTTQDNAITALIRSDTLPDGFNPNAANTISHSSSSIPIYAWYNSESTTIYYYSEATNIFMNNNSNDLFRGMFVLSDLSTISTWRTIKVSTMYGMFLSTGYNATTFTLDLSSWDTSNVTNMSSMFLSTGYNATTFTLDLSSWDTSNVTNMSSMFSSTGYNATTWSITISKTNNGTATGPIPNTASNLYGNTTSVTATPPSGRSFTLAN
ncbi:InlB B-repeat-containing protein [Candidatus Saccharibacteria bacterium]|nr:InlB B-repeat-containing protein [Candidatus Saccharibacteria bacterium]